MPTVERKDQPNQTAIISVSLEKSDYEPRFKKELNRYQKNTNLKGFRKGKTPMSVVKKMYGKAVLVEVVNELIQSELYRYLSEEEINILGQPLPAKDQEPLDIDLKDMKPYSFDFEVGLARKFEVKGIDEENEFEKYKVEVTEEMIDEELENAQRREGERIFPEGDIQENDLLNCQIVELEDGEPKKDGLEGEFKLLVKSIDDEKVKKKIMELGVGDSLPIDLRKLEKDRSEDYIRRYYLDLEKDDETSIPDQFELTIGEISRIQPAELDQEFFDNFFGEGEVSSEEEARQHLRNQFDRYYDSQAEALLFRDLQKDLMEKNQLELPDEFLKRWLVVSNEDYTEKSVEKNYDSISKNIQWSLVRSKIIKENGLQVSREEVRERMKGQVRSYMSQGGGGQMPEEMMDGLTDRLMNDEKQYQQVYEDLVTDRVQDFIAAKVTLKEKPIGLEEFEKLMQQARVEAEEARLAAELEEE
ncbi:MAG: trigger factor [Saprospiraceae bacterium]|nr:trigger factor [Saprospiraceae bacterium]